MEHDFHPFRFQLVELQKHCIGKGILDKEQSRDFGRMVREIAFYRQEYGVFSVLQTYADEPESALPAVEILLQLLCLVLGDASSRFIIDEKKLLLVATKSPPPAQRFFPATDGSVTYSVEIFMDRPSIGHRSCSSDSLAHDADGQSYVISSKEAFEGICEIFMTKLDEKLATLRANRANGGPFYFYELFDFNDLDYWKVKQRRHERILGERALRLFEKSLLQAKSRGRSAYCWWLLSNGTALYRYRGRLKRRQQQAQHHAVWHH